MTSESLIKDWQKRKLTNVVSPLHIGNIKCMLSLTAQELVITTDAITITMRKLFSDVKF